MPAKECSPPYEVLDFSEGSFFSAISNKRCSVDEVASTEPATYLTRYLTDISAKTIVVEHRYTDGDYLEDFASYYVRCYQEYERRCKRLHFFAVHVSEDEFGSLVDGTLDNDRRKEIVASYLGFVVARPLPFAVVGRTVLRTYPPAGGRRHYTAILQYKANLFGVDLTVDSLAFQEQDTVLAACATVALWSAFHKTADLFGKSAPRPAEITRAAVGAGSESRSIPSHGLNILQMAHAIRSVGLEPEVIPCAPNVPIVSITYAHLQFGLPVILGVEVEGQGLHAITLAGFSLHTSRVRQQEVASGQRCAPFTGLRIDELYGHDDQIGPFSRLVIKPSVKDYPVQFEGSWIDSSTGRVLTLKPCFLLVPVYNKIRVTFIDVQGWIERLWSVLQLLFTDTSDCEWDLQLTSTNDLKRRIRTKRLDATERRRVLCGQHPRFVWSASFKFGDQKMFELLADATDMGRSLPFYEFLWFNQQLRTPITDMLKSPSLTSVLGETLTPRFLDFLRTHT